MVYKKVCDECEVEFTFGKKDIKEKVGVEEKYLKSIEEKVPRKGFWDRVHNTFDFYTTSISEEVNMTYAYVECPICSEHILLKEVKREVTGKKIKNRYKHSGVWI